jgi:hypothetical protein
VSTLLMHRRSARSRFASFLWKPLESIARPDILRAPVATPLSACPASRRFYGNRLRASLDRIFFVLLLQRRSARVRLRVVLLENR